MAAESVERSLRIDFCESVRLHHMEGGRFAVETPFTLPNGDGVPIILAPSPDGWILTDEGETFLQLSEEAPHFDEGSRWDLICSILRDNGVEVRDGKLVVSVRNERYADALASLVSGILEMMSIRRMTREVVRATFKEDALRVVRRFVPDLSESYHHPRHDPDGLYPLDGYWEGGSSRAPLGFMFVANARQALEANATLLAWHAWDVPLRKVVVFAKLVEIPRKLRERLARESHSQFGSLEEAERRLPEVLAAAE